MANKKTSTSADADNITTPFQTPVSMENLYDLLLKQQARIEELEMSEGDKIKKSQEPYKGPIKASYRSWGVDPITSYISVKKDEAYDWNYKNFATNAWVNNHYVEITLANGKKTGKVLRDSFDTAKVKSEPQEFDMITLKGDRISNVTAEDLKSAYKQGQPQVYIFHTPDGEIQVLPNCVN